MKTFNDLSKIDIKEETVVALGNFDGVHLGHKKIIERAVALAKEKEIKSCVFTFSNHPRNMIPGKKPVLNIIYKEEKAKLIESLGIDYLIDVPFTNEIMTMDPNLYVTDLLVKKFNMKVACCGFNYHFGHKAMGDTELLSMIGKDYGFTVVVQEPVIVDSDVVSSTLIRELIKSGDIDECDHFLGRNYDICGEVVVGNRLGKNLGFATSNIMIDETMVTPPNGVYVTNCIYDGVKYPSITNVGVKPTIGEFKKNMETHIFDFDKELYGKQIRIEFIYMIRPEAKFASIEDLKAQIARDCKEAKTYHGI